MVEVFGATSTTDEVLSGVNLKGKRILVTGVSAGLGVETARALAAPQSKYCCMFEAIFMETIVTLPPPSTAGVT